MNFISSIFSAPQVREKPINYHKKGMVVINSVCALKCALDCLRLCNTAAPLYVAYGAMVGYSVLIIYSAGIALELAYDIITRLGRMISVQ